MRRIIVHRAGCLSYARGLALQAEAAARVLAGGGAGEIIVCEHEPVITMGRSGKDDELLLPPGRLAALGVALHESSRGGRLTCHNPGQAVIYPVLHLPRLGLDGHAYLRLLEEAVILALGGLGLAAGRKNGLTGVWVGDNKICAMGISLRKRVSGHGLALNVHNDLSLFKAIVPCGIGEFGVTSLLREGVALARHEAAEHVLEALGALLRADMLCPGRPRAA